MNKNRCNAENIVTRGTSGEVLLNSSQTSRLAITKSDTDHHILSAYIQPLSLSTRDVGIEKLKKEIVTNKCTPEYIQRLSFVTGRVGQIRADSHMWTSICFGEKKDKRVSHSTHK